MISYCHPPLSKSSLFLATVITTAGAFYVSQAKRRGGRRGGELDPAEIENDIFKDHPEICY